MFVHDPLGVDGLKTEEARLAVRLLSTSPVGDKRGVLVLGPMDQANDKASDVLLKKVEEPTVVLPVLWAGDLEGVRPTIRSRTTRRWCPGQREYQEEYLNAADSILDALQEKDLFKVHQELKSSKGDLRTLLDALVHRLASRVREAPVLLPIWGILRHELSHARPTFLGVWAALLKGLDV